MNLILGLKREDRAAVRDENGAPKYLISIQRTEGYRAAVYDDLGVTELLNIAGNDREFGVTAFDVPAGKFHVSSLEPLKITAKAGDWAVTAESAQFSVCYLNNTVATAEIKDRCVRLNVIDDSQLLMLVAVSLILAEAAFEQANAAPKKEGAAKVGDKGNAEALKKFGAKAASATANAVSHGAKKTVKALKNAKKLFSSKDIYKFSGKPLKKLFCLVAAFLILSIVFFTFGAVNTGINGRMKETTATVSVSADKKTTTAYFNMAGFQYTTKLSGFHYKNGDKFTVYYTETENHKLKGFYLKQKPTAVFFVLAAVCVVGALGVFLIMLYGVPEILKKRPILKASRETDRFDDPTVDPRPRIQAVETKAPQEDTPAFHFEDGEQ